MSPTVVRGSFSAASLAAFAAPSMTLDTFFVAALACLSASSAILAAASAPLPAFSTDLGLRVRKATAAIVPSAR